MRLFVAGLVCVGIFAAGASAATPAVSNPLVYFSFDNPADLGHDDSGNATLHNATNYGVSGLNQYAVFEGADDGDPNGDYMDMLGSTYATVPTTEFSWAAWARTTDLSHTNAFFNLQSDDETWIIHPELRSNRYRFTLRSDGGVTVGDLPNPTSIYPSLDTWIHVCGTYKAGGEVRLYVDGTLITADITSAHATLGAADDWNGTATYSNVGATLGKNIDNQRYFEGDMDEFYIFARELTLSEVQTLAAQTPLPEPCTVVLLALGGLALGLRRRA